jgi:hypothetical protein
MSRSKKLKIYRTLVCPLKIFEAETWSLTVADENALRSFERRILRKFLGLHGTEMNGKYAIIWK